MSDSQPQVAGTPRPEAVSEATATGEPVTSAADKPLGRTRRLLVWGGLSLAWLAYLALGQVNARFWVLGDFKTDYKPIRSIWRIQVESLPGGSHSWMVQSLMLTAMALFVIGVIAGLYVLLAPSSEGGDAFGEG